MKTQMLYAPASALLVECRRCTAGIDEPCRRLTWARRSKFGAWMATVAPHSERVLDSVAVAIDNEQVRLLEAALGITEAAHG